MTEEAIISVEQYKDVDVAEMRRRHGDSETVDKIFKMIAPHISYLDKCPDDYITWLHFYQIPEKYLTLLGIQYPDWESVAYMKRVTPEEYQLGRQKSRFEIDGPLEDVVAETVWKQWQTQLNLELRNTQTQVLTPEQATRLDYIREPHVQRHCSALMEFVQEHAQEWVSVLPMRNSRFLYTLPKNYLVYAWSRWPKAFQIFNHVCKLTELADDV